MTPTLEHLERRYLKSSFLIDAPDTVFVGDSFAVDIIAHDSTGRGFAGAYLHVAWDQSVIQLESPFDAGDVLTPKLSLFQFGDATPGRIDDLGGNVIDEAFARDGDELFAQLQFDVIAEGSTPISLNGGSHGVSHFPPLWDAELTFDQAKVETIDAVLSCPVIYGPVEDAPEELCE